MSMMIRGTSSERRQKIIKLCNFSKDHWAERGDRAAWLGEETATCPHASKVSAVWTCPCLLFHYGRVAQGPVCSPNTINKVSAAHQYCYLHRVLIWSPYNHKMLIAPINSQSVCALVWPPWALKVSVKMNCSLILLQEKIFFFFKTTQFATPKSKGPTILYRCYHSLWVAANGVESCDLVCPFIQGFSCLVH